MGLLDEAIREHLTLKRQHGADPDEVARIEHEALGPPVRETQEALAASASPPPPPEMVADAPQAPAGEPSAADAAAAVEASPAPALADGEPAGQATTAFDADEIFADEAAGSSLGDAPPTEVAPPPTPEPHALEPTSAAPTPEPHALEPTPGMQPPAPDYPPPDSPASEPAPPGAGQGTPSEPDPAARETTEGGEAEDVLEETPDFLQETPEHDRLWFEQKPPRDFDFDG